MWKQYIKQAWQLIKANPVISILSIAGTALSIATIMVNVLVYQVELASYAPETKRDRMLYVDGLQIVFQNGGKGHEGMSAELVKECFYSLQTPECVSAYFKDRKVVNLPVKKLFIESTLIQTDHYFWEIFDFNFLSGGPFQGSDFVSGIPRAVISETLAKQLFNNIEVVGETILMDFVPYTVCGVVKDVTNAAEIAHADIWIPYSTTSVGASSQQGYGATGRLSTCLLAHQTKDFEQIRKELFQKTEIYNNSKELISINYTNFPISHFERVMGINLYQDVSRHDFFSENLLLLFLLLLVPALNLSGLSQSSIQQRKAEIGIRKSFGATWSNIVFQVLVENLVVTCIGGIIGFVLSFLFLHWFNGFLFPDSIKFTPDMFLHPSIFILAFLFMLLLNLLSVGIPAFRLSRQTLVASLNENE